MNDAEQQAFARIVHDEWVDRCLKVVADMVAQGHDETAIIVELTETFEEQEVPREVLLGAFCCALMRLGVPSG